MDHLELTLSNLMGMSIGPNRVKGNEFVPLGEVPYGMEQHKAIFPLTVSIFLTHVRNCVLVAKPILNDPSKLFTP